MMSINFFTFFATFALFKILHGAYIDPEKEAKIDAIVNSLSICGSWTGMSISVVHKGEIVFAKGYGVIDQETNAPVAADTLFGIASLTKQFNAALLGLVLEENGLNWDTKVRDVLGEDFFANDGLRTGQMTMKDMATHRVGQHSREMLGWKPDVTREYLTKSIRFLKPDYTFRDQWLYNNNYYDVMAYIAEVLSGEKWEDLMTERIFKTLNMTKTTFMSLTDRSREDLAKPYTKRGFIGPLQRVDDRVIRASTITGGPGSITSSAEDFAKWMIMQLNKGTFNGVTVIPEDQIEEARTGFTFIPQNQRLWTRPTIPVDYYTPQCGLGLNMGSYRGYNVINHAGVYTGYWSRMTLLKDMDIGVFSVLSGVDLTTFGGLLLHAVIMDLMLDVEPWLNEVTVCTFPLPWIELPEIPFYDPENMKTYFENPAPKLTTSYLKIEELEPYTGQYGEFMYGNITVYINETTSQLMLHYGLLDPFTLEPTEIENVFYGRPELDYLNHLQEVIFSRSDEGLEKFDRVLVPFDPPIPSTFIRGLKMSDAPPPPDPNDCS